MVSAVVPIAPSLSVTVNSTEYTPSIRKVWAGVGDELSAEPSPKFQL